MLGYGLSPVISGFLPSEPGPADEPVPDPVQIMSLSKSMGDGGPADRQEISQQIDETFEFEGVHGHRLSSEEVIEDVIGERFDRKSFPWRDRRETTCAVRDWLGGCLRTTTKVVAVGLGSDLTALTDPLSIDSEITLLRVCLEIIDAVPADPSARAAALQRAMLIAKPFGAQGATPLESIIEVTKAHDVDAKDPKAPPPPPPLDLSDTLALVAGLPLGNNAPASQVALWVRQLAGPMLRYGNERTSVARRSYEVLTLFDARKAEAAAAIRQGLSSIDSGDQAVLFIDAYAQAARSGLKDARDAHERAVGAYQEALATRAASGAAAEAARAWARTTSFSGLAASLATLALLGIGLAVLAVERNTRAMRELSRKLMTPPTE